MDSRRLLLSGSSWAFPGATLDLDFVNYRGFSGSVRPVESFLTTTRASVGYSDNTAGVYLPFTSGQPRITDKGLLVEESRTNSIRNNSGTGAVAGTPGTLPTDWSSNYDTLAGLSQQVIGVGVEDGIDYVEIRYFGTASASVSFDLNFDPVGIPAASNGQTWTTSAFVKRIAGTVPTLRVWSNYQDGGGGFLDGGGTVYAPTTAGLGTQRASITRTATSASTASVRGLLAITVVSAASYDFTIRVGWPQLELGASATSPIRTTSAAATRAADAVSVASPPTLNILQGTLFAEGVLPAAPPASTFPVLVDVNNGTLQNLVRLSSNSSLNHRISLTSGGVSQTDVNAGGAFVVGTASKVAMAYALNDVASAYNGTAGATDATATMPVALSAINIGSYALGGGNYWNGYIRRVAYFPTRLTNAQLQAITR